MTDEFPTKDFDGATDDSVAGQPTAPVPNDKLQAAADNVKPGNDTNVQDTSKPAEINTNNAATAADKLSSDAATKQPGTDAPKPVVDTPETAGGKTAMEQANPKPPTDLTGKGTDAAQQAKSLEAQNGNPNLTPKPLDTTNGRVNGSLYYDESGAAKYKVGNQVYNYSEKDGKVTLTPPEGATYRGYEGTAAVTKLNQTTVITEKAPVAEQAKAPDNTTNVATDKAPAAADPNTAKVINQPLQNAGSDQIGNATKGTAPVADTVKPIEQPVAKPQDGLTKVGQDSPLDANAGKVTQPVANAPIPQANPVAQNNPIAPTRQTGTDTSTIRQTTPDNNVLYDRLGYKAPEAGTNIKVPEKVPDTTYKTPDVPQANQGGTNIQPYSNLGNTGKVSDGSHGAGSKSDNISSNLNAGKLDSSLNTGSGTSKDIVNRTTDNVIKTPEVIKDVSSGIGKNIDAATRGNEAIRNANETAADRVNQALGIKPGDAPNLQGGSILATDKTAIRVGDALKAGQAIVTADGKVLVVDKNGNLSVPEGALGKAGNVLGKGGEALDKAGGLLGKQLDLKVGPNGTVVDKNGNVIGKLTDGLSLTPGKLGEGVGKAVDAAGNAIKIGPDGKPILDKLTTDGKLASDGKGLSLDKAGDKLSVGKDGLSAGLGKEGGLLGTVKGGLEAGGTLSKEGLKGEKGITSADALGKTGTDAAGRTGTEKGTVALDATGKPIATNLAGQPEALSAGKGGEKGSLGARDIAAGQTTDGTTQANIAGKQQISSQQATTDALVAKATAANDGSIAGQKQELSAKEQQANKLDALTQRQQELEQSGKRVEKVDPAAAGARVGELGQREITKEQLAQLKEEQKLLEELKAKKEEGKEKGEEQTEQQRLAALALLTAAERKMREKEDLDKKEKEQLAEKDKKEEDSRRERYVVRDGDTLESIAAKRLRDKYLSALIFEINRNIIPVVEKDGKKIAQLKAKMVIYLPSQLDIKNYRARLFSKGTNVDLTAKSGTIGLQDKDVLGENEGSEKRAMDNDEGSTSAEADASAIGSDVLYPDQVDMVNKASQEGIKPTHDGIEPTNVDISSGESSIDDMERQAMLGAEARRANVERLLGPLAKDKAAAKSDTGRLKHTVRLGETLRSLAFSKFNDVKLWRLIAEVNNIATTLDSKGDPVNNQLKRGTSIELPTELEIVRYREAGFAHPSVNLNNLKENKDGLSRQQESIIAEAHQQVSKILSKHADSNDTVQTTNKECPSCQRLVPALAEMCSACLHVFDASSTQAQNHPSTVQAKEQPGSESAVKNLLGSLASSSAGYSTEKGPGDAEEVTDKVLKATGFSNEDKPVNSNRSTTLLSDTSTSKAQQTTEPTVALDIETQTLISPYEKFTTYNFSEDIRLLKFNYQRENGEQAHLAGLEVMHNGQWLRVMEYDMAQSGSYWKEYKLSGGGRMPTELNLPVKNVLEMVDTNLFINWRQYCSRFLAGRRIMD